MVLGISPQNRPWKSPNPSKTVLEVQEAAPKGEDPLDPLKVVSKTQTTARPPP